jgi:hypothetical protein
MEHGRHRASRCVCERPRLRSCIQAVSRELTRRGRTVLRRAVIAPVRDFGSCKTAPRLPTLLSKVMACRRNRF